MIGSRLALAVRSPVGVRNISTTLLRSGAHHDIGGVPGANLPFDIHNRWKLAVYMTLFLGSGFATPFILLRHQLLKKK